MRGRPRAEPARHHAQASREDDLGIARRTTRRSAPTARPTPRSATRPAPGAQRSRGSAAHRGGERRRRCSRDGGSGGPDLPDLPGIPTCPIFPAALRRILARRLGGVLDEALDDLGGRRQASGSARRAAAAPGRRQMTSSTSSLRHERTQPRSHPRSLADDGRRGHDADRDRRGLPRLQREQRPAVRAGLLRLGRRAERRPPRHQQRGAGSAARASAWSSRSSRSRSEGGDRTASTQRGDSSAGDVPELGARLNLKLDKAAEPLPEDSVFRVRYRSTFGLKYLEIVRGTGPDARRGPHLRRHERLGRRRVRDPDRSGQLLRVDPRGGQGRLLPGADRVRRDQQHLRQRDAQGGTREPRGLRWRVRRARRVAQRRDRRPAAAGREPRPGLARPRRPLDAARALHHLARAHSRDRRARRRRAGAVLHQRRDRLRRDRARPRGAQGHDLGRPAHA